MTTPSLNIALLLIDKGADINAKDHGSAPIGLSASFPQTTATKRAHSPEPIHSDEVTSLTEKRFRQDRFPHPKGK